MLIGGFLNLRVTVTVIECRNAVNRERTTLPTLINADVSKFRDLPVASPI